MNYFNKDFIKENNLRILSCFTFQPRYTPEKKPEDKKDAPNINDNEKIFLMAVYPNQYQKSSTEIYKLAGFTLGNGSRIGASCVKKNLVKMIQIKIGRGSPKYPILLPEAYKILGVQEKKFYGKGAGDEHVLYQHLIAEHFTNYKPVIELNRNNKFMDVGIQTNEFLLAVEVAMTSVNEKKNIIDDLTKAKADYVIVACRDAKVLKEVIHIIDEQPEDIKIKSQAILIADLLKQEPEKIINNL